MLGNIAGETRVIGVGRENRTVLTEVPIPVGVIPYLSATPSGLRSYPKIKIIINHEPIQRVISNDVSCVRYLVRH